ncbi:MAG: carbohydrate ABC transporter permease [Paracoccaceae bacterium]|jgi:multiple sugar transport system permease protein
MTIAVGRPSISRSTQMRAEAVAGYAFATPALVLILLLLIAPIIVVFMMSLTDYQLGALDWSWVGLGNYAEIFSDRIFLRSLGNTFIYVAIVVPGSVILGLLVAILVHERTKSKAIYQTIFFLPVTTTLIAMSVVWHFLLNPSLGPITSLSRALGWGEFDVFGDPNLVLVGLAVIGIWQLVGFNMILFLAGLTAIPRDLYDAADIDGADGAWDRFARVTWPMLGPTTLFVVVTTTITAFRVFDTVAVITRGNPQGRSDVLLYTLYKVGFQDFNMGPASAMTIVFLVFVLVVALVQAFVIDRRTHY